MKDLVVGVPDGDIAAIVNTLLEGWRPTLNFEIVPIKGGDSVCRESAPGVLRSYHVEYLHALVVFDLKGSGRLNQGKIETTVREELQRNGWNGRRRDRAAVVVIDPEIEEWIWSIVDVLPSWVRDVLGKTGRDKKWFKAEISRKRSGLPKRTTSQWYGEWAAKLPGNCQDPAFQKLMTTLQRWFP
ncbi:MAG: hypothetical protein OXU65_09085 [Deltaproteobacteria bacterium]|nr:hypothetical protein [Deltaproteobacteria bacterium]